MKLKNRDIIDSIKAFNKLTSSPDIPFVASRKIIRNAQVLDTEIKKIQEDLNALNDENLDKVEFEQQFDALMDMEVDVDIMTVSIYDLKDLKIEPVLADKFNFMID